MNTFFKFFFGILGGILIGFGLGIIVCKNSLLAQNQYEAAMVLSLVMGGFFTALAIPGQKTHPVEREQHQLPPQQ